MSKFTDLADITTRESFIAKYLYIWNQHYKSITESPQNYKTTNKYAKELLTLYKILVQKKSFLFLLSIIDKEPDTLWGISLQIAIYEPELWKKLYKSWYESNPEKHWVGKFRLENWDNLKDEISWDTENYIKAYMEWKESNPWEYEEFINSLRKIISRSI